MIKKLLFIIAIEKIKYLGINLILKFIWKNKCTEILKKTLRKKSWAVGDTLLKHNIQCA